jgi:hypothetical protein
MTPQTPDLLVNSPGETAIATNNSEPPPVSKELIGKAMGLPPSTDLNCFPRHNGPQ